MSRNLRQFIAEMARSNPTWGEERIADELLLKIGISISPRTVRRYMPRSPKRPAPPQRWMTFVRNHAKATIASDFFVVVTATFQLVYVFLIMEVGTRRIRHVHVTRHPTAEWTLQQFRECITGGEGYKFIIHDRDDICSEDLDASLKTFGLRVLRTPYRSPQANSFCDRLVGSARRECLDFMIPLDEAHIGQIRFWPTTVSGSVGAKRISLGPNDRGLRAGFYSDCGSWYSEQWMSFPANRTSTTVFVKSRGPICFSAELALLQRNHVGNNNDHASVEWFFAVLVTNGVLLLADDAHKLPIFQAAESTVTDMVSAVARRMSDGDKGCVQAFVNQKLHVGVAAFRRRRVVRTAFRFAQGRAAGRPRRGKART